MTEIWLAFIAGLAGSGHCLGMCGGIVAALAMVRQKDSLRSRLLFQLLYNTGRITTYTLLGVTAGLAGASLDVLTLRGAALWVFAAANLSVIIIGLATLLRVRLFHFSSLENVAVRLLSTPLHNVVNASSSAAAFPLGLMLGFLPCGLVYAPLLVAAGTGRPLMAAGIMAALGIGTTPLLLLFGSASTALSGKVRDFMLRAAGLMVALMGMVGLWRVLTKM